MRLQIPAFPPQLGNTHRSLAQWVHLGALFALSALLAVGCDAIPQPQPVPTFIPPTVAIPTVNPGTAGTAQTPAAGKSPGAVLVTRGTIAQTIRTRGRVGSVREAFLYFPLKGAINKINVAAGDQVSQGALLAQLDTFDLDQGVDDAQLAYEQAKLELRQAQAKLAAFDFKMEIASNLYTRTLDIRNKAWNDYQALAWIGLTDPKVQSVFDRFQRVDADYLRAATDLNTLKADKQVTALDVDAGQLAVQHAQKRLDRAQARLSSAKLSAPFAGLIASIDKKVGDEVLAFEPIGALADPSQLQIEATITESDAINVGLGQTASIVLDGFSDQKFSGKVKEIASRPTIFQGKSVYRITVAFDNPSKVPATIRLGADVQLITQIKNNVLVVPTNAIVLEGTKKYVTAIRNGKPQRVEVQVGIASDTQSEILSGIAEGEQIQIP